jgi:hypothetical protein
MAIHIRRREAIFTLCGVAVAWPLAGRAQQPDRLRRIGVLMGYAESDSDAQAWYAAFREELQKLGWTEGRNTQIYTRWATPADAGSMRRFAKMSQEKLGDALGLTFQQVRYDRTLEDIFTVQDDVTQSIVAAVE